MVSWDTYMLDPSAACDAFKRPEICSGEQSSSKSLQTVSRSVVFSVSSVGLGAWRALGTPSLPVQPYTDQPRHSSRPLVK